MKKIADILKGKQLTYSFELSPPRTPQGVGKFWETVTQLAALKPDWFSLTYGAGGSTRDTTTELVEQMAQRFDIPVMHHLTCMGHTVGELENKITEMKQKGICNILALRGDIPRTADPATYFRGDLRYGYELVRLLRAHNGYFSIGVAGFPEGHPECPDLAADAAHLKSKLEAGAEFVITQFYLDNEDYFRYVERVRRLQVGAKIIPGILPFTDYQTMIKVSANCGARVPPLVSGVFAPLDGDTEAMYDAGREFSFKQCDELLGNGAPGIHFYTFNKTEPTREIVTRLRWKYGN